MEKEGSRDAPQHPGAALGKPGPAVGCKKRETCSALASISWSWLSAGGLGSLNSQRRIKGRVSHGPAFFFPAFGG